MDLKRVDVEAGSDYPGSQLAAGECGVSRCPPSQGLAHDNRSWLYVVDTEKSGRIPCDA